MSSSCIITYYEFYNKGCYSHKKYTKHKTAYDVIQLVMYLRLLLVYTQQIYLVPTSIGVGILPSRIASNNSLAFIGQKYRFATQTRYSISLSIFHDK